MKAFFYTSVDADEKDKPRKRGRGSQEPTKKHRFNKSVGHIKMIVIDDLKSKTLDSNVIKFSYNNAELTTDDSTLYVNFKNIVQSHMSQEVEPKQISNVLPWVHSVISNAKRLLLDIYHDIKPEFFQNYMNEFCYKFPRRKLDMFERLKFSCQSLQNRV